MDINVDAAAIMIPRSWKVRDPATGTSEAPTVSSHQHRIQGRIWRGSAYSAYHPVSHYMLY
jgi:hypothetical protein